MNGVQGNKTCESKLSFLNYPYRYSKKKKYGTKMWIYITLSQYEFYQVTVKGYLFKNTFPDNSECTFTELG